MKLVTGGCSFSEIRWRDTWPSHLAQLLPNYEHISTGLASQGNGLISRRIIYQITEQLKTIDAKELLVGIMWSGPDRHDFFTHDKINSNVHDGWVENPSKVVKDSTGAWIITNSHWKIPQAVEYYKTFYDQIGHWVYTCEHILRVQWFLKFHNIKYFMSAYTKEVFPEGIDTHPESKYLYDQIDFLQFLPIKGGEYEWCKYDSGIPGAEDPKDIHPTSDQHEAFTKQIIIPFLKDKNYI
jgi:hypothetical protein